MKTVYVVKEVIRSNFDVETSFVHIELGVFKSFADARKAAMQHIESMGLKPIKEHQYPLEDEPSGVFTVLMNGAIEHRIVVCGIQLR